jgi:hypothetical protein
MEDHERYTRDEDVRVAVTDILREAGYSVEGWSLADKPADDTRVLTIKAERNLRVEQQKLGLV